MSKTIPSTYDVPGRLQYTTRSTIDVADWEDLIEGLHYLYAHAGARFGGEVDTTGTALPSDGSTVTLDTHTSCSVCTRYTEGDLVEIRLNALGATAQVDARIINAATGAEVLSLTASTASATPALFTDSGTIAKADTLDGSSNPAMLYAVVTAETSSVGTAGALYGYTVDEQVISDASKLPDGL